MFKKIHLIIFIGLGVVLGFLIWWFTNLSEKNLLKLAEKIPATDFHQAPIFVGDFYIQPPESSAQIFSLALHNKSLVVSFLNSDCIQVYSESLELLRTICFLDGEPASITGLFVEADRLYATNYKTGELHIIDFETNELINSFGFYPDQHTRMKLFGLAYRNDIIYVSDSRTNQILAISATNVPGIKSEGELLLSFPSADVKDYSLSFPTFLAITPDGRLLVSDVGNKMVKAFTCNGRFAHYFDQTEQARFLAPMGIAFDNLPSPELISLKDSIFDPSGVYEQGRIHIVDTKFARVKVFNSLGKYVLTYGDELEQPNGIVIDNQRRIIYIADTQRNAIALYKY